MHVKREPFSGAARPRAPAQMTALDNRKPVAQRRSFLISVPFKPFFKKDFKLGMDLTPVLTVTGPFLRDINHCQIQHFQETVIGRKYRSGFSHFPELPVESFDRIGRIMPISS